jgi:hypothetical protein
MSIVDALEGANPNYKSGRQYEVNCQRCVQAYELRRRGYTVQAKAMPRSNNTICWGNECFVDSFGNTPKFEFHKSEDDIKETLKNALNGSRYIIYTRWENSKGAHVFVAEKENDTIKFVDPQSNETDVEYYFSISEKNRFGILRVDDKTITKDHSKIKATVRW